MKPPINYDAEFCGRVPLHQTNSIQPHGVLLVIDKEDLKILQASENADALFEVPVEELVKKHMADFLSEADVQSLKNIFSSPGSDKIPFVLRLKNGNYLSFFHQHDQYLIIDVEKEKRLNDNDESFLSVYQKVKFVMASLQDCTTTEETCNAIVKELKALSGFDKIMIYRFDEAWNGDVIAEAKEEGMESYLGLKFPASDIPKQARELYKKTPFRLIPTTEYEPVKLFPVLNPATNAFTNLSDSSLRSVAAVHLEYLRDMQVTASMSTRILKDGELWGLIACHHRQPNYLSYEMCSVFELASNVIASKITAAQSKDVLFDHTKKQEELVAFMQAVYGDKNPRDYKNLLISLLEADGVAVIMNNQQETVGATPSQSELEDLVLWLSSRDADTLFHEPSLSSVYEGADAYAQTASGVLALPIDAARGNFIIAFRKEAVQHVAWGGNPSEAIQYESDGKKYHPRASFKLWQQTVKKTSIPWHNNVLESAEQVKNFLATEIVA